MTDLEKEILNFITTNEDCKKYIINDDICNLLLYIKRNFTSNKYFIAGSLRTILREIQYEEFPYWNRYDRYYTVRSMYTGGLDNLHRFTWGDQGDGWVKIVFLSEKDAENFIEECNGSYGKRVDWDYFNSDQDMLIPIKKIFFYSNIKLS